MRRRGTITLTNPLRRRRARQPRSRLRRRQTIWAYVFLSPALALFGLTVVYPMLRSLQFSFFSWPLGAAEKRWVGLDNYRRLILEDDRFRRSVGNTVQFTVGSVLPTLVIALVLAIMMNAPRLRGRGVYRTIYFLPVVTSLVAVAYVWRLLLEPSFGLVNTVLGWVGIDGPGWLTDPSWAMPGVIGMTIWRDVGYYMVIFLAGLQTIPRELGEAARIDGATRWQHFRRITLPLLNPSIVLATIVGVIYGLQLFTQVYVMTGSPSKPPGGPLDSTTSVVLYIVQSAFQPLEMGYPSAAAMLLFVLIMLITLVQLKVVQRRFDY